MEKAFREKKCISSKFELARFHQVTDDLIIKLCTYIITLYVGGEGGGNEVFKLASMEAEVV